MAKSNTLPHGTEITTYADGSTRTIYKNEPDHQDGVQIWRNAKGEFNRASGPAVVWPSGHREWWKDGKLSRKNGPAVERVNGNNEFWRDGVRQAPKPPVRN